MSCIIALETATEACSVALLKTSAVEQKMLKRFQIAPREHTKLILPMLDSVLEEAGLQLYNVDAIAFGRGPGAFTGLRIATGVAQGLALSVDKPVVPVSSLAAMALAARKSTNDTISKQTIIVAIDARMGEVYWAVYDVDENNIVLNGEEQLSSPQEMFLATQNLSADSLILAIGSGWDKYIQDYPDKAHNLKLIADSFPSAEDIASLACQQFEAGKYKSVIDVQPVYLRNQVAEKPLK